jgi:EAL domain-containing protein (putative c-di-GMP-specific phosphodiesterase class I)
MTAFATTLTAADGTPRGFVAIHLGAGQSAAKRGLMAPSLLRPVLECLAARIHLETVAEHVESAAQAEKLQELEVDLPQGYYCGNPVALERVLRETVREDR